MSCCTYGIKALYLVHPDVESRVSNHLPSLTSYGEKPQSFLEYAGYYLKFRTTFPPFLSIQYLFPSFLHSSPHNLHKSSNVVK